MKCHHSSSWVIVFALGKFFERKSKVKQRKERCLLLHVKIYDLIVKLTVVLPYRVLEIFPLRPLLQVISIVCANSVYDNLLVTNRCLVCFSLFCFWCAIQSGTSEKQPMMQLERFLLVLHNYLKLLCLSLQIISLLLEQKLLLIWGEVMLIISLFPPLLFSSFSFWEDF